MHMYVGLKTLKTIKKITCVYGILVNQGPNDVL